MSNEIEDSQKLTEFSHHLEHKIDFFVFNRGPSFLKIRIAKNTEKSYLMFQAWKETKPRFEELRNNLSSDESITKLKDVGLTGSSLAFKLSLVEEAIEELMKEEDFFEEKNYSDKPKNRLSKLRKLKKSWRKYFDHADTIIGSIGAAGIPGADAIGEFKTGLEKILDWWGKK